MNKKRKKHKPGIPGQAKQVAKQRVRKGLDAPLPSQPKTPTFEELRTWLSEITPQLTLTDWRYTMLSNSKAETQKNAPAPEKELKSGPQAEREDQFYYLTGSHGAYQ